MFTGLVKAIKTRCCQLRYGYDKESAMAGAPRLNNQVREFDSMRTPPPTTPQLNVANFGKRVVECSPALEYFGDTRINQAVDGVFEDYEPPKRFVKRVYEHHDTAKSARRMYAGCTPYPKAPAEYIVRQPDTQDGYSEGEKEKDEDGVPSHPQILPKPVTIPHHAHVKAARRVSDTWGSIKNSWKGSWKRAMRLHEQLTLRASNGEEEEKAAAGSGGSRSNGMEDYIDITFLGQRDMSPISWERAE